MGMELPKSFRILDSVGHTPEALQRPNCSAWTLHCACPGQRIALALSLTFADLGYVATCHNQSPVEFWVFGFTLQ